MREDLLIRSLFIDNTFEFDAAPAGTPVSGRRLLPMSGFIWLACIGDALILYLFSELFERNVPPASGGGHLGAIELTAGALAILFIAKLYAIETIGGFGRFLRQLQRSSPLLFVALLVVEALFVPTQALGNAAYPHAMFTIFSWLALAMAALILWRHALFRLYRLCVRSGLVCHHVVVVGTAEPAAKFIETLRKADLGPRIVAAFDDAAERSALRSVAGVPVRGGIADLLNFHKHHDIDTVVVALPLRNNEQMHELIRRLSLQPLRVRLLPGITAPKLPEDWFAPTGELPGIQLLRLTDLPIERSGLVLKTLFDKLVAAAALLLFAPLMLLCAAIIKITSPGPVFFMQPRIGLRNRTFQMYKFRSMHVSDGTDKSLTARNDKRIFPFGHVMRKLSLDELPQLLNVLKGDMSMVGPRPHMPEARAAGELYYNIVTDYAARHRVKPGITGWAQINGWRGPTETFEQIENRVLHDLYYIENWSLLLDIRILFRTALVGFFGKNAF